MNRAKALLLNSIILMVHVTSIDAKEQLRGVVRSLKSGQKGGYYYQSKLKMDSKHYQRPEQLGPVFAPKIKLPVMRPSMKSTSVTTLPPTRPPTLPPSLAPTSAPVIISSRCGQGAIDSNIFSTTSATATSTAVTTGFTSFTSSFYVVYLGATGTFEGTTKTTVQNVLRDSYNEVQGCNVDLLLDAVIIAQQTYGGSTRRLASTKAKAPTRAPTKSYSLTNYCTVSGKCRSCTSGTKLFNDALRRRLQVAASAMDNTTLVNLNAAGIPVTKVTVSNGAPPIVSQDPTTFVPTFRPTVRR